MSLTTDLVAVFTGASLTPTAAATDIATAVDTAILAGGGAGAPASGTVATLDGTGFAGSAGTYSKGDHKHADTNRPSDGQKAALAGTSGAPAVGNKYVTDADARNTDSRTPTSHSHAGGDLPAASTILAGIAELATSAETTAGLVVQASDTRLSDARTALGHSHPESDITSLVGDLAAKVPTSRTVTAGAGLAGGGDLSADRGFSVNYGTTNITACRGDDARLSDARTPTAHSHAAADLPDPTLGSYAPGSFTVPTGKFASLARRLTLTTTQRATVQGTACIRIN